MHDADEPSPLHIDRIWSPRLTGDPGGDLATWLLCRAFDRFHAFAADLELALAELLADVLVRMERRVDLPEWLFVGPRGTPAFELLAWLGEAWIEEPAGDARLETAAEAMLVAYLAVRAEDDLVDEPWGDTRWAYLIHALHSRARLLMGDAGGHADGLAVELDAQARAYAEAATIDARLRAAPDAPWAYDAVELQGAKFLPMAGPLCALAHGCGHADETGAIVATVRRLGIALQLTNDLLLAGRDLAGGLSSPLLRHLELVPGRDGDDALTRALRDAMASGRLQVYVGSIAASLLASVEPLDGRAGDRYREHVDQRLEVLRDLADETLLRALTADGAPP